MALSPRARVSLLSAGILLALVALVWYLSARSRPTPVTPITPPAVTSELPDPTGDANSSNNNGGTSPTPPPAPPTAAAAPVSAADAPAGKLSIPVAGIRPEQLQDTYTQSRSEGRTHNAIDIMAPRNTPVVAAADGQIVKLFNSERGGITLYQLGTDNRTVYYYAHLERYADGITENRFARRGELLGYVGDSGNAGKDNCHLHFSIWLVTDPKRFWDGENVNPYSLLTKR